METKHASEDLDSACEKVLEINQLSLCIFSLIWMYTSDTGFKNLFLNKSKRTPYMSIK